MIALYPFAIPNAVATPDGTLEACLVDVMLKVLGHQGRSPGSADSKQHKTEPSDLQRLHLGKTIGKTRGVERLPFPTLLLRQ